MSECKERDQRRQEGKEGRKGWGRGCRRRSQAHHKAQRAGVSPHPL